MGWWNSLVDGVSNAAGWVIDNASTISTVVSTVAKVASLIPLAEEEETSGDSDILSAEAPFDMPRFISTMGKAENVLKTAAYNASEKHLKAKFADVFKDASTTTSQKTYSGLWAKPIPGTLGVPGQEMTSDLSHMLAMIKFPQTLQVGNSEEDVVQRFGQSIFKSPVAPLEAGPSDTPYDVVTTSLSSEDGSETIVCSHAYYAIPSGGEGNEQSWHSAISLSTVQTSDAIHNYQQARLKASKVPKPLKLSKEELVDLGNIWQVTLNILWTAATYAAKAAPLVANYLMQSGAVIEIKYINTDGLTTFIQIKAGQDVTPFQAREAVLSAANSAVIDVEAQNLALSTKKTGNTFKPTSSGITQVDILANKLMPYDAPSSSGAKGTSKPTHNGVANGTSHGTKKTAGHRQLVTFKPYPGEFEDGIDSTEIEYDGAQFYVPVFPINSRKKVAQD